MTIETLPTNTVKQNKDSNGQKDGSEVADGGS